ncbi:hypothetical protein JCM5353_001449 [Sporobolomyces roseus]
MVGKFEEVTANQVTPSLQIEADESQSFTLFHSFLYYLYETTSAYLFALITSPSSILFDPLSTFTALLIYPILWSLLAGIVLVLWIGGMLGCGKLVEKVAERWFGGFSTVNWANPEIFKGSEATISNARGLLGGKYKTTIPPARNAVPIEPFTSSKTIRIFSIPLAKTFLLLSALVYERKDKLVLAASRDVAASKRDDKSPNARDQLLESAQAKLSESEETIWLQAAKWGFEFTGICELGEKSGGPFASLFFSSSLDLPFIVLVFKGTGPDNFSEILIDASIDRVPASAIFGPGSGTVHRGFYTSLFMAEDSHRASGADSYGAIVNAIKATAARIKNKLSLGQSSEELHAKRKIPLWITAHSLGGSLASLCFARFLRSPADLGDDIELRDCYAFGTPRSGDGDFASAFENSLLSPRDRPNILWRIENHFDVVTRLPLGIADNESARSTLSSISPLNYAHLSPSLILRPLFPLFASYRPTWKVSGLRAFHAATDTVVTDENYHGEAERVSGGWVRHRSMKTDWMDEYLSDTEKERRNKIRSKMAGESFGSKVAKFSKVVIAPFYDHFPAAYLENLNKMQSTILRET